MPFPVPCTAFLRGALWGCVYACTAVAPAFAQSAPAADAGNDDEIIVTGLRASATAARNIKRNAEVVVDSITAHTARCPIARFREALQRIPGITLQRTNEARDPARLAAEGGGIFVRALQPFELNGRDVFSANNGRGLSFEDISADLVAGVDVYKNPSADMIEGGVGGLVNLRTRKPLHIQKNGQIIAVSGDWNYADLREKGFWSASGLYSNRWKVLGGEIGILLSGSINNTGNRTDSIQPGRHDPITPDAGNATANMVAGTTYYIPNSVGYRRIDWQQRRTALNGVVQVRPIPEMTFTFEGVYAKATPEDGVERHRIRQQPGRHDQHQLQVRRSQRDDRRRAVRRTCCWPSTPATPSRKRSRRITPSTGAMT